MSRRAIFAAPHRGIAIVASHPFYLYCTRPLHDVDRLPRRIAIETYRQAL